MSSSRIGKEFAPLFRALEFTRVAERRVEISQLRIGWCHQTKIDSFREGRGNNAKVFRRPLRTQGFVGTVSSHCGWLSSGCPCRDEKADVVRRAVLCPSSVANGSIRFVGTAQPKFLPCVVILLPVATNQLKAQNIQSATRRTAVFGSDQRESPRDFQGLPGLCVERR